VRAQALLHQSQEQAQGGALEIGIALQKVAQALGHRQHPLFRANILAENFRAYSADEPADGTGFRTDRGQPWGARVGGETTDRGDAAGPQGAAADLAIVDAHQHFWDPGKHYYPWLNDQPRIAFRYGDYGPICRPYLPPDYRADTTPLRVERTVYVEAEWDPRDPTGEMRYIDGLRREFGLPTVAVAQAWLDLPDAPRVLEQQAAFAFVRSVRHKPRANTTPADGAPGGMTDARWRAGYAHLARNGLRFDLQTPWWHLPEAARLATDFAGTQIILNHTGLPSDRSREGVAGWRKAMTTLAACPNAAVKISGLGQPGQPWTVAANRDIVRAVIDLFGVARCMFASNFPVDSLCASFATIFGGFREIVADFPAADRRALFRDNAMRLYAMP
jgi:predicted TIM-barrel fold metal-dependent hydrolase